MNIDAHIIQYCLVLMKQQIKFSDKHKNQALLSGKTQQLEYQFIRNSTKKNNLAPQKNNLKNSINFRMTHRPFKPSKKFKSQAITPQKEKQQPSKPSVIIKFKTERRNLQPLSSHPSTPNSSLQKLKVKKKSTQKLLTQRVDQLLEDTTKKKVTQYSASHFFMRGNEEEKNIVPRNLKIQNKLSLKRQLTSSHKYSSKNITTPAEIFHFKDVKHQITEFESQQIAKYRIFFLSKRRVYGKLSFTDKEGNPIISVGDGIAYRYQILNQLGSGAFGRVYKAFDHKIKQVIALKIIKNVEKLIAQSKVQSQILYLALQKDPQNRSNLIKIKDSFIFRGHPCMIFELLHVNLYELLKINGFRSVGKNLLVKFAIQILHTLNFLKKHSIIHCDIKPQNIMLKEENKTGIKVIDVGSGCFEGKQIYTYIQSRFYRAPEIMLGIKYTSAIDIWSFGCVLAELNKGYPLFPGNDENQQMYMFIQTLGKPPNYLLDSASRRKKFFNSNYECKLPYPKNSLKPNRSLLSFDLIFGSKDKKFIDFIKKCLEWDPKKRITPKEALLHEWILDEIPENIRQRHIAEINTQ